MQSFLEDKNFDFDALSNSRLRLWKICLKDYSRLQLKSSYQKGDETSQDLSTDVGRLSHLAYWDCPADVCEGLALQFLIGGIMDSEIQITLRMTDITVCCEM